MRIGKPLRPEFAAWRYGDQFGRRRRRAALVTTGMAGAIVGSAVVGIATGITAATVLANSGNFYNLWLHARTRVKLSTPEGKLLKLKFADLQDLRLGRTREGEWSLALLHRTASVLRPPRVEFTGPEAERVAGRIMPHLNAAGGGGRAVQDAVHEIERIGGPEAYLGGVLDGSVHGTRASAYRDRAGLRLDKLPTPTRLALEMALHEEQERIALEGELEALELAWREAEEIAAIADDLLVPDHIRSRLARARAEERGDTVGAGVRDGDLDADGRGDTT